MNTVRFSLPAMGALLALAAPVRAQQQIPVRAVTPAVGTDSGVLGAITGLRHLPAGHVLVSDGSKQRLVVFDSTLSRFTITADTSGGSTTRYGSQLIGGLIEYVAY